MPRLTQLTDEAASSHAGELFSAIKSKIGMVPNVYRVMANEPAALAAHLAFSDALSNGSFDAETREAIALAAAGRNNCDYCASAHSTISRGLKVDDEEINARLRGQSANDKLNAILGFATAIVDKRGFADDADLAAARKAGLTDGEIVETIANVVSNILTNYINHVAETEIDFPVTRAKAA